jgi:hypothetical protein
VPSNGRASASQAVLHEHFLVITMQQLRKTIRKLQLATYKDPSLSPSIGPFGHAYPWQLYTQLNGVELTARMEGSYPAEELQAEFKEIVANFSPQNQHGQYHRGGWSGVALHALDGDPLRDDDDISKDKLEKTPALKFAPTMEKIIDSFPADKRRVRILSLEPGKQIFWHREFWHSVDSKILRLHIPVVTNPKVGFQISHQDCPWQPGELWYGDFTFPHRLQNGGTEDRIHLVIDLVNNDAIKAMLPESLVNQVELRSKARERSWTLMKSWNQLFATEARLQAIHQKSL